MSTGVSLPADLLVDGYPAFSEAEMARRHERLCAAAAGRGAPRVLLVGAERSGSAVQWITGWPVTREAYAVVDAEHRDTLAVQFFNHVPQARQIARSADVLWAGPSALGTVLAELRRRGQTGGQRCNPHPHVFSDRLIRPGDQAYFDIIHAYNGYRTCYYRTFAVGRATQAHRDAYAQAREWIDAAIALVKPGVSTDQIARAWPKAEDFGFASEKEACGLQFGHGLGVGLHERPIISRLNSLEEPVELQEGMVFALETYCPAPDGPKLLTLFPAEELVVTNRY